MLDKITKTIFLQLFSLLFILKSLLNGQNREFKKNSNCNMRKTPSKMHMHDMVTIDAIVLEIVGGGGGGGLLQPPLPRIVKLFLIPKIE